MTTTKRPTKKELHEKWYLLNAQGYPLGRLASRVARLLIGKEGEIFDPAVLHPVKVIVINAAAVKVTGKKMTQKIYYRHSGYMGGLKSTRLEELMAKKPTMAVIKAVSGMLPKNRLRKLRLANLKVYPGTDHPHIAQKPVNLEL